MTDVKQFFLPGLRYAVVGATTDHAKYGYRVLVDLKEAGFDVVGVNPKYQDIDGVACYSTLTAVLPVPNVAVFVVPPTVGLPMLSEVARLGITKVWFQPGAESAAVRARAAELNLAAMANGSCIMVARRAV